MFLPSENGYDLHFCTKKYEANNFIHTWNRWNLGKDVLLMLNEHRKLPLELSVEKILARFNQKSCIKKDLLRTKSELEEVKKEKQTIVERNERQRLQLRESMLEMEHVLEKGL